jgi:hypothetical protein
LIESILNIDLFKEVQSAQQPIYASETGIPDPQYNLKDPKVQQNQASCLCTIL